VGTFLSQNAESFDGQGLQRLEDSVVFFFPVVKPVFFENSLFKIIFGYSVQHQVFPQLFVIPIGGIDSKKPPIGTREFRNSPVNGINEIIFFAGKHAEMVHRRQTATGNVSIVSEQWAVLPLPSNSMGVVDYPLFFLACFPAKSCPALSTPHLVAPAYFVNQGRTIGTGFGIPSQQFDSFYDFLVAFVLFFFIEGNPAPATDGCFA
jgi:hypothetical protein